MFSSEEGDDIPGWATKATGAANPTVMRAPVAGQFAASDASPE